MSEKNSVTTKSTQTPQEMEEKRRDQRQDRREAAMTPPVDVVEDATAIILLADLPGVSRDKLNVQFESDSLIIEGEVSFEMPEGMESSHAEVRLPRYRRVFNLSKELDTENSSAEFKDGVLKLRIPKAAHVQPRRIEVKTV